jgi:hypothetical protein
MNRFLLLIACALVGIFVSSCAPIPHRVVPKPAYGSHSGAPHYLPLRHPPRRAAGEVHRRVLHATHHHRHAQRRATIATHHRVHHRVLNPWNASRWLPIIPRHPRVPPPPPQHESPPGALNAETDYAKLGVGLLDGPRRREAALRHARLNVDARCSSATWSGRAATLQRRCYRVADQLRRDA